MNSTLASTTVVSMDADAKPRACPASAASALGTWMYLRRVVEVSAEIMPCTMLSNPQHKNIFPIKTQYKNEKSGPITDPLHYQN
jgi:hypothetical protein